MAGIGERFEVAGGDVGGGHGDYALDGDDETFVALYALDVAFGTLEEAAGYAHMLAGLEVHRICVHILKILASAARHQLEYPHLVVGDDGRLAAEAIGEEHGPALKTLLDRQRIFELTLEKEQRVDSRFLGIHLLASKDLLLDGSWVVTFYRYLLQFGFQLKDLIIEDLEGKPTMDRFQERARK